MAKFCPNCGTALEESSAFCPNCGTPVGKSEAPQAPAAAPQAPQSYQAPAAPQAPVAPQAPQTPKAPPASAHAPDAVKPNDKIQGFIDKCKANPKRLILPCAILAGVLALVIVLNVLFSGGYTSAIDNVMDTMNGDANALEDLAPDAYWDYLEEEEDITLKDLKKDFKEEYEEFEEMMKEFSDGKIKYSYKVEDKDKIDKDDLEDYEDAFKDQFDRSVKITDGYELELEIIMKQGKETDSTSSDMIVLKIDGKWYCVDISDYGDEYRFSFPLDSFF